MQRGAANKLAGSNKDNNIGNIFTIIVSIESNGENTRFFDVPGPNVDGDTENMPI